MNQKTINWTLTIALAFILLSPVLLTLPAPFDWMQIETKDRPLGDTIGGITAPFINGLGSILLFVTIWIQLKTNEKQNLDALLSRQFDSFMHDLDSIKSDIYIFPNSFNEQVTGFNALLHLSNRFHIDYEIDIIDNAMDSMEFAHLCYIMGCLFQLHQRCNASSLPRESKDILNKKIELLYFGVLINHAQRIYKTINNEKFTKFNEQKLFVSLYDAIIKAYPNNVTA